MNGLLHNAPCGLAVFNDKGILRFVNTTLAGYTGHEATEVINQPVNVLLDTPGQIFFQTHFFPMIRLHGKAEEIFINLRKKDGAKVPVVASAVEVEGEPGWYSCAFLPVYRRREYEDRIIEARRQAEQALYDNEELRNLRQAAEIHARELDRRIAQLDYINDELVQFNEIVNHDMQECARKILLYARLARTENDPCSLDKVIAAAQRLKIINSSLDLFLSYGKLSEEPVLVDLGKVLNDAVTALKKEEGFETLELHAEQLPYVEGYPPQLQMLFHQLLSNCIRFRRKNKVQVKITRDIFEENMYRNLEGRYAFGEVLRIRVTDDGTGFDMALKEQLLNMLRKGNTRTEGFGIGLTLCRKIIDNHHGKMELHAQQGVGTTVEITLPMKMHKPAEG
jgi:sigma-B regulation protein RsbU (phosphoserine phosphatase)